MSRTWFLAAIAVAALMMQFFPTYGGPIKWVAIVLGAVYLIGRALGSYPKQYRDKRRLAAQRLADAEEFRQYTDEMNSLRAKYAVSDSGPDAETPDAYAVELSALHAKHRAMLERKFGYA